MRVLQIIMLATVERETITHVYGSSAHISTFKATLDAKYDERVGKGLGQYTANTVMMTTQTHIAVHGVDPIFHSLSMQERAITSYDTTLAAVLVQKWGYGFYHFVCEMLPKILRVFEYNPEIPIVIFYNDTFIKDILAYAKVTNPIIPYDGMKPYFVKEVLTITDTPSGNPRPSDIQLIRKYMCPGTAKYGRDLIILIYRKEALRTLRNFDEIYDGLMERFPDEKFVCFDSMSLDKTVALFQRAKLIIGVHGAGLTNMVFATKGISVIEIFPADLANACYWHLSWILGNKHKILTANSSGPPLRVVDVDLDELCSLVADTFLE